MLQCKISNNKNRTNILAVHSFDIFDTLFTRRTAVPVGIFKIMQYKLSKDIIYPNFIADNFFMIRTETEAYIRRNRYELCGAEDVTLDEIYDTLKFNYNLSDELTNKIKNLEIELEINNVVPLRKNIELYKKLKSDKNNNVILVSDMYLPESVIRKMLVKADPCFEDAKLYLSCECNHKTKHYGSLYEYVQEKENISLDNWIHYGDNPHADIFRAKKFGIRTKLIRSLSLSDFSKYALKNKPVDCIIDAIIGASKISKQVSMSGTYTLGTDITGPLLYSYVNYVIKDALSKSYCDLYFVARDGYILKQIADLIIKKRNLQIKTHYLYGSRFAWRLANAENYDNLIDLMLDEYKTLTNAELLSKRLRISHKDLYKFFGKKCEDFSDKKEYAKMLKQNEEFKNFILAEHEKKRQLLVRYFKQECGQNPKEIILVDLDGSGKTQDCLSDALNKDFDCEINCYYFFQFFTACQSDKSKKYSYLLTENSFANWIEILTRNIEGQVLEYRDNSGVIEPVFDAYSSSEMKEWGFNDYILGIKEYANNIIDFEDINGIDINSFDLYMALKNYINLGKDKKLANMLGSIIYSDIGNESGQCAKPITIKECLNMLCGKKKALSDNLWQIRLARSGFIKKGIYKFYKYYGSIRKFVINITLVPKKEIFEVTVLGMKFHSKKILRLFSKLKGKN